jgi:hypothetical protein
MATLSRNAQVLKFFAQHCKGIGRTKLQKLAYISDVEARKLLGHPITSFEYYWHHHGPFDGRLYEAIEELDVTGYVQQGEINFGSGYQRKTVIDKGLPTVFDFTPAELTVLEYVASEYIGTPLTELLSEVVYESEPMLAVNARGERLPMEILDNTQKNAIGFDLEEVIAAEQAAKAGDYVLASDFFNALRTSFSTASATRH